MKMTIAKRIILGFAATVLITAGLGAFTYSRLRAIQADTQSVATDSLPGLSTIAQAATTQRLNALDLLRCAVSEKSKTAAIEKELNDGTAQLTQLLNDYEKTVTRQDEREMFEELKRARATYNTARDHVLALADEGKQKEAIAAYEAEGDPAVDAVDAAMSKLLDLNERGADDSAKSLQAAVNTGTTGVIVGLGVTLVVASFIGVLIIRGVNGALKRIAATLGSGAEQVAAASSQVSSSSQSLAQGASEQAASLEETSSALEEMSSMTKKNAESAQQAAGLAGEAKSAADKGNAEMDRMGRAIGEIEKSASETAKIIKVIDEIAFQTNLLALNAAVEAARAGEAGKGFAVVAEEVRNLAMRSAEAAKNTAAMIEESVKSAKNGVQIASEVGKTLADITSSNEKVNALISEIAAASAEQAQGIGQVNTAVTQMDKVTQANAAAAEESASASEELSSQAMELNGVVSTLMELVTGTGTTSASKFERRPVAASAKKQATASATAKPAAGGPLKLKPSHALPLDEKAEGGGAKDDFSAFNEAA
jgi:methyl-accepting chemotaxis protein